ncbi:PIN domain-containing protein [Cyclobacterium xiamenense]|uniref:PIN domain-containing protein n=1 Tax=Cyclobacterium xiamenense TaxID=1297121 RepID=UPI0012B6B95F|nr:PIN domain-containing protein [Cyclobacterium xiamenense]
MIVPDTSIWIEFLKQNDPVTARFLTLLKAGKIAVIEPIFAELLYGVRKPKDKELVLSYWQILPKLDFERGSMLRASHFANDNNFHNLGMGLMDASIMQPVINNGYQLWTLDKKVLSILDAAHRFD